MEGPSVSRSFLSGSCIACRPRRRGRAAAWRFLRTKRAPPRPLHGCLVRESLTIPTPRHPLRALGTRIPCLTPPRLPALKPAECIYAHIFPSAWHVDPAFTPACVLASRGLHPPRPRGSRPVYARIPRPYPPSFRTSYRPSIYRAPCIYSDASPSRIELVYAHRDVRTPSSRSGAPLRMTRTKRIRSPPDPLQVDRRARPRRAPPRIRVEA